VLQRIASPCTSTHDLRGSLTQRRLEFLLNKCQCNTVTRETMPSFYMLTLQVIICDTSYHYKTVHRSKRCLISTTDSMQPFQKVLFQNRWKKNPRVPLEKKAIRSKVVVYSMHRIRQIQTKPTRIHRLTVTIFSFLSIPAVLAAKM